MTLLVYSVTAIAALLLLRRYVRPISAPAAVLLLLLPLALTGDAVVRGRVFGPLDATFIGDPLSVVRLQRGVGAPHNLVTGDIYMQMMPWRQAVKDSLARGEWPLWNPYILCGDVLAAAAQPAPYSPFTLIALLLPVPVSFTFTAAITLFLAAAGVFFLARELDCGEAASMIAAIGFMASAPVVLYVLWPLGLSWALLPLVLLATRRVIHPGGVRGFSLLLAALTLLLLAGHPETALHVVAFCAAYGVFELIRVRRRPGRAIALAVTAGVVSLTLCAVYLLPILEAIPQTAEFAWRNTLREQHAVRDDPPHKVLVSLATDFFPFLHIRRWVDPPDGGGMKAETAAVGSIILALALYAMLRGRGATRWFLGGAAVFCLVAQSEWPPLMHLFHRLPLFDVTRNERLAFAAACALALLAAIGVEALLQRRDWRFAAIASLAVLAVLTAGTLWIEHSFVLEPIGNWGEYRVFAEIAFLGLAVLLFVSRPSSRVAGAVLAGLLLMQRVASEGGVHHSFDASIAYPRLQIFEPLREVREPFRIVGQELSLIPATNTFYGLEDVRGYEAMTFAPYFATYPLWCRHQTAFFNRVEDVANPFVQMMNVRFAFVPQWIAVPPGWRLAAQQRYAKLMENMNPIGRAFVPATVLLGRTREDALAEMRQESDFRLRGWVEEGSRQEVQNGPGRVAIARARYGYDVTADMEHEGWVFVTESSWKGWRTYVDGRRIEPRRANVAFLAVHVPQGRHEVKLRYWPQSFVIGRTVSGVTLLGLAALALWSRRRRAAPPATA